MRRIFYLNFTVLATLIGVQTSHASCAGDFEAIQRLQQPPKSQNLVLTSRIPASERRTMSESSLRSGPELEALERAFRELKETDLEIGGESSD